MNKKAIPSLSVLVCTRNRGSLVAHAVESILASDHPDFELVVVDQSDNDDTGSALKPYLVDRRLKYLRSSTVGKCSALNAGLSASRGAIVAITDDDCVVPPNWLKTFEAIFAKHVKVAVAFCVVEAVEHDKTLGFVPDYVRIGDTLLASAHDARRVHGLGAGSAVRRTIIESLDGFDPLLGPGSRFSACEDRDIAIRALLAGYQVCETAQVSVKHSGFRTWAQGRELARRDFRGIGAAYSKFMRCGRVGLMYIPVYEFLRFAVWPMVWDLIRLRRPSGLVRVTAFIEGFVEGVRTPIDASTLKFIEPRAAMAPPRSASAQQAELHSRQRSRT